MPPTSSSDPVVVRVFHHWSRFYDHPAFQRAFFRRVHRAVLRLLEQVPAPRRALDLGCGTSQLTADLARRFPDAAVLGADLSRPMLHAGRERAASAGAGLVQANVYALPVADGTLDLVTSSISYHWYRERRAALEQIRRALRPGGHLLLATLSSEVLHVWPLRRAWELGMADRARVDPPARVRADLDAAGLGVLRVVPVWPLVRVFVARRPPDESHSSE